MAIKISGTTVIDDSRDINNIGILTATKIADSNGSVGTAASVLSSTGTGLEWVAQSGGGGASGLWESNTTGINTSTNVGIGTTTVSDATLVVDVGTASTAVVVQGSEGRLFSVTNSLSSGSIFSVNDISGIPSIDVDADGTIQLAPYSTTENIGVGITNPTSKLHVVGSATVTDTLKVGTAITANAGIITATTFDGSLATTNLTGTITNAQLGGSIANDKLAGSIANAKLSNSSVSYGGISLALGGTDATPAFDLTDATNYPYTSLTGIVTHIVGDTTPQLGGNLDGNSKDIYGVGILTATKIADSNGSVGTAASVLSSTGSGLSWVAQSGGGGADVGVSSNTNYIGTGVTNFNFVGTGITASLTAGASANTVANVYIPSATRTTNRYIATADQTTFSATYTVGYVDVFLNGIKLDGQDEFTATNGTSVVLTDGATVGDIVEIVAQQISANLTITGITDVVSDTTPQLGGDLDINGKEINGTGDVNLTGIVTATTFSGTTFSGTNINGGTFSGNVDLSGLLKEGVNITAGKLSDNTSIDLANGMVHLFTTEETTTSTPNLVFGGSSVNAKMSTGEAITVVIITTADATGYSAQLTIDSGAATEQWLGGSAPAAGGADGYDVYTHNIIKTADATFVVLSNLVNFT